ncbi:hypothetical protein E2C01_088593 [Portunus trituberculatus]|uniref:Uncharacterized protein n=1 Tax=Portunus trituberculatus TaxID=210409 RepID=A0A5B7JFV6_PORTR|nr:hypothetical protein [Portunus trituberculatus]
MNPEPASASHPYATHHTPGNDARKVRRCAHGRPLTGHTHRQFNQKLQRQLPSGRNGTRALTDGGSAISPNMGLFPLYHDGVDLLHCRDAQPGGEKLDGRHRFVWRVLLHL